MKTGQRVVPRTAVQAPAVQAQQGLAPDALARLLRHWRLLPPVAPKPVREQLGAWMGWTDAIALSRALAIEPGVGEGDAPALLDWARAALDRLLQEQAAGFADRTLVQDLDASLPLDELLAPYRLHHAQQQRAMAARVASLRERLRMKLAGLPAPGLQQLAHLDAVLELALLEPERRRLASLPDLLVQRAALQREALWHDLQDLLDAELALRLQPVLGLIEALEHEVNR
jgi:Protein of unknown function (DUF3348)